MTQEQRSEVLQGTLDLIVLRALATMGPMHGWGLAQRIQQVSSDLLQLNQGTLYPALLRLAQQGLIRFEWGVTENNRKAKYYEITALGRKQLREKTDEWHRMSAVINALLKPAK